jgi:hypothetical protein
MPESCTDRPTTATEKVFLLTKSARYYYDAEAVKEVAISDHGAGNTFTNDHRKIIENSPLTGGLGQQEPWNDVGGKRKHAQLLAARPRALPRGPLRHLPDRGPRRAILAGSSERGACPKCRAPWARQIEVLGKSGTKQAGVGVDCDEGTKGRAGEVRLRTIGWRPTCECDGGRPIPATVLDPFAGSGTALLVADQLQRDCIGIELNPSFAKMAEQRIRQNNSLFARIHNTSTNLETV